MAISQMANIRIFRMFCILVVILIAALGSLAVDVEDSNTMEGVGYSQETWNSFLKHYKDSYMGDLHGKEVDLNDKEEVTEKQNQSAKIQMEERILETILHKITYKFPTDFGWSGLVLGLGTILAGREVLNFRCKYKKIEQSSLTDYTIPYITTSETEKIKHFLMKERSQKMSFLRMIVNGGAGLVTIGGLAAILATPIREHWIDKPYVRSVGITIMGCGIMGLHGFNHLFGADKDIPKREYYTIDKIIFRWKNKPYKGFLSDHLTDELREILLELDEAKAQILLRLQDLSRDGISWLLGYEYSTPESIRDQFPEIDELLVIENITSKKLRQIWGMTGNVQGSNMSATDYKLRACWGIAVYGAMNSLGKLEAKLKRIMKEIKKEKIKLGHAEDSNDSVSNKRYVSNLSQERSQNRKHDVHHNKYSTDLSLRASHISKGNKSSNENMLSTLQHSGDPVSMTHSRAVGNKSTHSRAESRQA